MINIILTDLACEKLKLEEEIQNCINDKVLPLETRIITIKTCLKEIVLIEQMIGKWTEYTTPVEKK